MGDIQMILDRCMKFFIFLIVPAVAICSGCSAPDQPLSQDIDVHSYANTTEVVITHIDLDLRVDFDGKKINGRATLHLDNKASVSDVILDTRNLSIERITFDDTDLETTFSLGPVDRYLGQSLSVALSPETQKINIYYSTNPDAAALQWLAPEQTAGGRHPFLFTQSQAILARTWVPCQDSPGVRFTYSARVSVPPGLMAVMSAENSRHKNTDGIYTFTMTQPIPSYLLALAVGDFEFRSLGPRSAVFAETPVLDKAAWEFAETEKMMAITESLYGPYSWDRYDLIVLPPSFPFGGMENPRLTFATPTILAGDRSLLALVAHELAHSWSGNLVTNATWNDFWINEGFTTYIENRIMEALYGKEYADMLALLSYRELVSLIEEMGHDNPDTRLHLNLTGRDPDDGMTDIAYEKGAYFLRMLEENFGREQWDIFLKRYFDEFAFETMTSEKFLTYLREHLVKGDAVLEANLKLDEWVYGTGLPDNCPTVESEEFSKVEEQLMRWTEGTPASQLVTTGWTTHHWLHFIRNLPADMTHEHLVELDGAFNFTNTGNSEILTAWLLHAITHAFDPAYPSLERFLTGMGRRKFLVPLYSRLAETAEGMEIAERIYEKARLSYHPISYNTIDDILKWKQR
jgi:leukotriene-A4 hydrolase